MALGVAGLIAAGVTDIVVNACHLADAVARFVDARNGFGVRVRIAREDVLLETGEVDGAGPLLEAALGAGVVVITGGPGTGKTRTLTHRLAHLVATGAAQPEECLAVTFTRRAAEEMPERLAALLAATTTVPAQERRPVDVVVVLDTSGSMENPLDATRARRG